MTKKKIIVWALYDDAESSYKNSIKHFNENDKSIETEVHSIGINNVKFDKSESYFYHRIDLSLTNFELFEQLDFLPKPDIILASPPCESWSRADCDGRMFRTLDNQGNWVVKNHDYYVEYNKKSHPNKRRFFEQKEKSRLIGEATIGATIMIIKHFKPKVWVIENPKTSKSWDFQKNHWSFEGLMNLTYYASYDENFSLKPTIFKSNIELNLKKNRPSKTNSNHMAKGSYSLRSAIPLNLINDIMIHCVEYINKFEEIKNGKK
ncbi:DNA methyltransferase [Mycoplasmopsis phocirhinis]|uniref:DNA methyltransferase n=1 Tax=Mycoplasmopsis phocirhinis TaxID=142650 RepID=A0A4P6MR22_9BACT|nr:DNA methyltransferase [Mycoplasmopsis phocirhinis]QBF34529.1 DNA methyltransferase [Mycoplasmopsis phocirhinis]